MAHVIKPENIKIGPADIWWGITLPATGDPMTHTEGEPPDGTYVGITEGPAVFTYTPTYSLEEAEQMLTPVEGFVIAETATLEFNLKEFAAEQLAQVMQNATLTSDNTGDPNTDLLEVGGNQYTHGAGAGQRGFFLSSPQVGNFDGGGDQLFSYLTVYRVINTAPFVLNWDRKKGITYKCTFTALAAYTRPVGDRLFQLVRERADSGT